MDKMGRCQCGSLLEGEPCDECDGTGNDGAGGECLECDGEGGCYVCPECDR